MWFHIDPASGTPIYRQVVDQVRQAVASGILRPGDKLPSVRDLALELTVNPNTIAKAYQELERDGVVETPRGKGSFIADRKHERPTEQRRAEFSEAADRLVAEAYRLGISADQALAILRDRLMVAQQSRTQQAKEGEA